MVPYIVKIAQEKTQLLNTFFTNQTYLDEVEAIPPDVASYDIHSPLVTKALLPLDVQGVLKSLATGTASGPKGLSNRILEELSKELAIPLCSLFNLSSQKGVIPSFYKVADICPFHKKYDKSLMNAYRPISILNSEAKVFKDLFKHLKEK